MTAAAGVVSRSAPEMRPVVRIIGFMLLALAGAMLVPAGVDALSGDEDWRTFVASAAGTLAAALGPSGSRAAGSRGVSRSGRRFC